MSEAKPMRLLVCGGRDYADRHALYKGIADVLNWRAYGDEPNDSWLPPKGTVIISGGASGADEMAIDWAIVHWVPFEEYRAEWNKYGKKAGYLRNKRMLDEGQPDHVLAAPGGKGTANMVALAKAAGVPVTCI